MMLFKQTPLIISSLHSCINILKTKIRISTTSNIAASGLDYDNQMMPPNPLESSYYVNIINRTNSTISLDECINITKLHASNNIIKYKYLNELLYNTNILLYIEPNPKFITKTPEFEEYLNKMRIKQEKEMYSNLVGSNNVKNDSIFEVSDTNAIRTQLSIGLNIVAAMATGAILGYYLGNSIFHGNIVWSYICALIGIMLAMALEIWLFIVRAEKEQMLIERDERKNKQTGRLRP